MALQERNTTLLTVGEIANRLGVAVHIVTYALSAYRIEPSRRAGIIRLFDEAAFNQVAAAVQKTAERRRALA